MYETYPTRWDTPFNRFDKDNFTYVFGSFLDLVMESVSNFK